jgi:hypothetical protein
MKPRALQSSTAHYFDGGSYRFSEAGQAELAFYP